MLTRHSIEPTIRQMEVEIQQLKLELYKPYPSVVRQALEEKLGYLEDNCYRYKLQAKAWKMKVDGP